MAKGKNKLQKVEKPKADENCYVLHSEISEDQREYIEGVRKWLQDSLQTKGRMIEGPI